MKILCVIDSLGSGGAQRQLVGLALGFNEKAHQVTFLIYHNENFFKELLDEAKIPVICIFEQNYLQRLVKIRKYIRKGNFNAVLSFLEAPSFICEMASLPWRQWKLIIGERSANPAIMKEIKLRMYRVFHILANYVVANSHENIRMLNTINPLFPLRKGRVIYNLIDFEIWKPLPEYIPLKNGKLLLIVVASHSSNKNLNGLIEALHILSNDELSKLIVHWYGFGITVPQVDNSYILGLKKIKEYKLEKVITFFPATTAIQEVIQSADVVGLFSFFEGFPNVFCEAMACAKPIISSKVSDIPIVLSENSHVLFDPNNIGSIKESLSYILKLKDTELKELGYINLKISKSFFDKETVITQYLELLK